VRALVKPELADTVKEETYRFCESALCDVVYYAESKPEHHFLRSDLRVRVGLKETAPPIPVCYCFDWTSDDIEGELRFTGTTTIPDRIKEKVQQGFCHCETMNPEGTCCLGNVNKAVKAARASLAALSGAETGEPHHNRQEAAGSPTPSVFAMVGQPKQKGAVLASLASVFTAILASACCWLPLLLIAFGFSAAGVGSVFEQYRVHLLCATFTLLAIAWYLTYRASLVRAWTRLTGKPGSARAVEACCATKSPPAASDSCCATGKPVEARFPVRWFNQVMLWIATAVILLFAIFPQWLGLFLPEGSASPSAPNTTDDQQQVVLQIEGMTCEACAATVEQALRNVPGVSAATVSFEKKQGTVFLPKGVDVPRKALLQAVREAGYEARFLDAPTDRAVLESPLQQRVTLHVEGMTKVQGIT
jgi:copper chaperone CopZ